MSAYRLFFELQPSHYVTPPRDSIACTAVGNFAYASALLSCPSESNSLRYLPISQRRVFPRRAVYLRPFAGNARIDPPRPRSASRSSLIQSQFYIYIYIYICVCVCVFIFAKFPFTRSRSSTCFSARTPRGTKRQSTLKAVKFLFVSTNDTKFLSYMQFAVALLSTR